MENFSLRINNHTTIWVCDSTISIVRDFVIHKENKTTALPIENIKSWTYNEEQIYYFYSILIFLIQILFWSTENPLCGKTKNIYIELIDGSKKTIDLDDTDSPTIRNLLRQLRFQLPLKEL
jgi:hypothetical protein